MKYALCLALLLAVAACSVSLGAEKLNMDAAAALPRVEAVSPKFPPLLREELREVQ